MFDMSLFELMLATVGVLVALALLSCICCLSMRLSDLKLKSYILELANKKGIKVDPDKLDGKCVQSPLANQNCAIYVPDLHAPTR